MIKEVKSQISSRSLDKGNYFKKGVEALLSHPQLQSPGERGEKMKAADFWLAGSRSSQGRTDGGVSWMRPRPPGLLRPR